ncbi:MAG: hypothetical protein LBQ22_05745 [Bacteroidales bacterium]|jgi:hypothetical protein|nr:hypothetical protein [Bacteroidales bacterium]
MGLLIGVGNTKPTFPYDYYYGIEWDSTVANPACTRIGRPELHVALPVQSGMRRCILKDDGTVNYYLHATDSTKRDNGAAANLDGTDGQVMVEIPAHYRKFEVDGTIYRCFISQHALPGFHFVPLSYRSAYEAAIDRTTSSAPKLASVVNLSTAFRGGGNTAAEIAHDADGGSVLGKPATGVSLTNFRAYARRRGAAGRNGAGWNCDVYDIQKTCFWLYFIEYANLNCQAAYNAQPTSEGYKQGGLGAGVTDLVAANITAMTGGTYACIPCGITNSLGNKTGIVTYTMPTEYGATKTTNVPSYRGLENPFGHLWSWTDGVKVNIQSDASGGLSQLYICEDPENFQSNNYDNYQVRGLLPRKEGYVKRVIIGEYGENMPAEVGAASTTYFCDYFYTSIPASGESQRGVFFGGSAANGAFAGFGSAYTANAASSTGTSIGSRLCFIP